MKPVNIVLGRFQPYTKGHQACVDAAFDEVGLKTVLCIIETPDNKVDERHPFPTSMIIPWIEKMMHGGSHIQDYVLVKNADIAKIADALHSKGYELASWTCGTDRYPAYSRQCKGYWEKVGLPEEPKCIEVKRGDDDVSATKAREALKNNDPKAYDKLLTPEWRGSTFTQFRHQLLKVVEDAGNQNRYGKMKPLFECIMEAFNPLKPGVYKFSQGTIEIDTKKSEVIFSRIVGSETLEYHIPLDDVNEVVQAYLNKNKSRASITSIQHDNCGIVYQPLPNTVTVRDSKTSKFGFEFSAHELQNIIKK